MKTFCYLLFCAVSLACGYHLFGQLAGVMRNGQAGIIGAAEERAEGVESPRENSPDALTISDITSDREKIEQENVVHVAANNSSDTPDAGSLLARVDKILQQRPAEEKQAQPSGSSQNADVGMQGRIALPVPSVPIRHQARQHDEMITPGNFEYLGGFRPPHQQTNGSTFAYGGWALAYRPDGDAGGPDDGFPGSLYIVGHREHQMVAEISIPCPVITQNRTLDELSTASVLQSFSDVTGGLLKRWNAVSETPFHIGGLIVAGDRLHWTVHKYYNVDGNDFSSHGTTSLDFSRTHADGPWHLGPANSGISEWHSYKHAGYIFEIPRKEAESWFGGFNLISGLQISTGLQYSSQGPSMFAYRLPPAGTPAETSVSAIPLVWYSEQVPLARHNPADRWTGGAWLTLGNKQAVVIAGRKGLGPIYYGVARPGDCSQDKGYHGSPYETQMLFYSPASLIRAAHGQLSAHALEPWLRWDGEFDGGGPGQYFFRTCSQSVGGMAYDRKSNILYLVQVNAGFTTDNEFEPLPVIHAFRIVE